MMLALSSILRLPTLSTPTGDKHRARLVRACEGPQKYPRRCCRMSATAYTLPPSRAQALGTAAPVPVSLSVSAPVRRFSVGVVTQGISAVATTAAHQGKVFRWSRIVRLENTGVRAGPPVVSEQREGSGGAPVGVRRKKARDHDGGDAASARRGWVRGARRRCRDGHDGQRRRGGEHAVPHRRDALASSRLAGFRGRERAPQVPEQRRPAQVR